MLLHSISCTELACSKSSLSSCSACFRMLLSLLDATALHSGKLSHFTFSCMADTSVCWQALAEKQGLELAVPPPKLCTDNGVMVAWAGIERMRLGLWEHLPAHDAAAEEEWVDVRPRWPLTDRWALLLLTILISGSGKSPHHVMALRHVTEPRRG